MGLMVVFNSPLGPFILKLTPNKPSPASLGMMMLPINGIFEIILFKVFGTKVPLNW